MKQGVFWIIAQYEDNIQIGNYNLIYRFDSERGHSEIWEELQKEQPLLRQYDYETFPRGRVWSKNGKSIIFINSKINTPSVINRIKEIFKLSDNYTICEDQ